MKKIVKITKYHDVLCSWCYLAQRRLEQVLQKYKDFVKLEYKTFLLAPDEDLILKFFGSREEGKQEIMRHWQATKSHPDGEAINPDLMKKRSFDYPYSLPAAAAVKCAELQGGSEAHIRYFDAAQKAHLVGCHNVADPKVLIDLVQTVGLDVERFIKDYESGAGKDLAFRDHREAVSKQINAVPTVIINNQLITGAVPTEQYEQVLNILIRSSEKDL